MAESYTFNSIFVYSPVNNTLVPNFKVIINNVILPENVAITPSSNTGGVNLFNYINRSAVGTWDAPNRTFTIEGFA